MRPARIALLAAALGLCAVAGLRPPPPSPAEGEPCWSVQLHLHGSFSEGLGSIDSHAYEGSAVAVDALWWSDHDFRITSFHMLHHFSFDALSLPLADAEAWEPVGAWEARRKKTLKHRGRKNGELEIADFGQRRGLRVRSAEPLAMELTAGGAALARSLAAEVELELWVRVAESGPGASGLVGVGLSEHAPLESGEPEEYRVRYLLGEEREPRVADGVIEIGVPVPVGEWTRVVLPLTRDVSTALDGRRPGLVGADNALTRLSFGVEASGAAAEAHFDDLHIRHGRAAPEMYARQAALIEEVGAAYPELRQLQGLELSLASPHLNEFSLDPSPPDYAALLAELGAAGADEDDLSGLGRELAPLFAADVHARGGLVSYNHPFGASWGIEHGRGRQREVLDELIAVGVHGADILEVGYRARGGHDLEQHLWVWDRLARAGYPLVGTGVSDSHGGPGARWRTGRNNLVSWIFAPAPERADLLEGLRRGRVFFGDLTRFDGRLDLVSDRGFRMGRVVLTDRAEVEVELAVDGAAAGNQLRLVVDGSELARERLEGARGTLARAVELHAERATVVRFELFERGEAVAFSNPIVFARQVPEHATARLGVDLGGLVIRELGAVELRAARSTEDAVELSLACPPGGAALDLDTTNFGAIRTVTFADGGVEYEARPGSARLRGLAGEGTLRVVRGGPR